MTQHFQPISVFNKEPYKKILAFPEGKQTEIKKRLTELKKLDLYKCSLRDINLAYEVLGRYLQKLIDNGGAYRKTDRWVECKKLHVSIARAKHGADKDGYMIGYNIDLDRLPNNKSVLQLINKIK